MIARYTFRICAALPGHEPVELFRSLKNYTPAYFHMYAYCLSPEWDAWVERPMSDKHAITPRIKFPHHSGAEKLRLHLTRDQRLANGITMPC